MMLNEVNERLKDTTITENELSDLSVLYILLDLEKDDFCKIIDSVGVEKLLSKQRRYDFLLRANDELIAKEKYLKARERLDYLEREKSELDAIVNTYVLHQKMNLSL